jgi:molybdopterin synthase catalytic subunit
MTGKPPDVPAGTPPGTPTGPTGTPPDVPPGASAGAIRVRVRLFAMQRELAGVREVGLELPVDADIEAAWAALVALYPALPPGRVAMRFARNGDYSDATEVLADGDELACIPPVSGGSGGVEKPAADAPAADAPAADAPAADAPAADTPLRLLELRAEPIELSILADLGDRLATDGDGAIVGFVGRTRVTPGTPAPGQEAEAARHAGREVRALEYEAHETMAMRMLDRIADEIAERFGVVRIAIVHRVGIVALGEVSIAVVAVSPHRDAAFAAARYAIDETKGRVPIWKAEQFADGHVWIGEPPRSGPPPITPGTIVD